MAKPANQHGEHAAADYAAIRWKQMTDPYVLRVRPFWVYKYTGADGACMEHKGWHNLVLPSMHPWFRTHFPPNGPDCHCQVSSANLRDLARLGKTGPDPVPNDGTYEYVVPSTGEVMTLPKGVQYGWDYTPGAVDDTHMEQH